MEDKKGVFTIINNAGEEIECEILFTFDSDETKKSYIVYTDNSLDENGSTKVYASIYDPDDPKSKLEAIKTEIESVKSFIEDDMSVFEWGTG